jgi:hypothetical protein
MAQPFDSLKQTLISGVDNFLENKTDPTCPNLCIAHIVVAKQPDNTFRPEVHFHCCKEDAVDCKHQPQDTKETGHTAAQINDALQQLLPLVNLNEIFWQLPRGKNKDPVDIENLLRDKSHTTFTMTLIKLPEWNSSDNNFIRCKEARNVICSALKTYHSEAESTEKQLEWKRKFPGCASWDVIEEKNNNWVLQLLAETVGVDEKAICEIVTSDQFIQSSCILTFEVDALLLKMTIADELKVIKSYAINLRDGIDESKLFDAVADALDKKYSAKIIDRSHKKISLSICV